MKKDIDGVSRISALQRTISGACSYFHSIRRTPDIKRYTFKL